MAARITIGQFFVSHFYVGNINAPAVFAAVAVCAQLIYHRTDAAALFIFLAVMNYGMLEWQMNRFSHYYSRMDAKGDTLYSLASTAMTIVFLYVVVGNSGANTVLVSGLISLLVVSAWMTWLMNYVIWPNIDRWYGDRDEDVSGLLEYIENGKRTALSRYPLFERKLLGYKCSPLLSGYVMTVNLLVLYFVVDGDVLAPRYNIDWLVGSTIVIIYTVCQFAWWLFIKRDDHLIDAYRVLAASPRFFVDMFWLMTLVILPVGGSLLAVMLVPNVDAGRILPYLGLVAAEICVFYWVWLPRRPEG